MVAADDRDPMFMILVHFLQFARDPPGNGERKIRNPFLQDHLQALVP